MQEFLRKTKYFLEYLKNYTTIIVILGNQTCDLDSAVCALVEAFHEYSKIEANQIQGTAVIPLFNIPQSEFRLKTEVCYYLKFCQVPLDLLTFRDQIDLIRLSNENKLKLVLVDHHTLSADDASLKDSVVEIIDHRPEDEHWIWKDQYKTIKQVGSCATLVAEKLIKLNSHILDEQICKLLRGPILIDTVNFSEQAKRSTPLDVEIIQKLESIGKFASDREKVYQDILDAKTDISELTPSDLLLKDLKVINEIPIAGFPILVKDFMKMDGAVEAVKKFASSWSRGLVILIGMNLQKEVVRDLGIYSAGIELGTAEKIINALKASTNPNLEIEELHRPVDNEESPSDVGSARGDALEESCPAPRRVLLIVFSQGNVRATRKQILPIVGNAAS